MEHVNNYTLGRGRLFFGQFGENTNVPRGERYLGNSPELTFTAEQETLDHYSSDEQIRLKDQSVILQQDYNGSFTLDSIDRTNLSYFLLGDASLLTQVAETGEVEIIANIETGVSYQLGVTASTPSGVRKLANVSVTDGAGTPVPYELGVDFELDVDLGRVTILPTGAIPADSAITVTYDVEAHTRQLVVSRGKSIEGSLRFIANNPAGDNLDYFMPWVKLSPNGDFTLKGDDWQTLPFNLEILKKGSLEAVYVDGRPFA